MTLRFFLDENLPPNTARPLAALYPKHVFRSARDEFLSGIEDVDLIEDLAARDYSAIITGDRMQLQRPEERKALRDHSLHWIGMEQPSLRGIAQVASISGCVITGLAHVLDTWPAEPSAFMLGSTHRQPSQFLL